MTRKKKSLPILENIEITDCAAEGKSLARVNDMVVFVPFCVPGDIVDIQIKRKKNSYAEGEVKRFRAYSKIRSTPMCEHFGLCGGCKWQLLPYDAQLKMKQKQVYDQLHRIGKLEIPPISPILGSKKIIEYRNKLDFGASNRRYLTREEINSGKDFVRNAIGFHIMGAFDKILPIEKCYLMDDFHNKIRNAIRDYALQKGLSFFDIRLQHGLLRDIMIRNSNTGEWMVLIQFHFDDDDDETKAKNLLCHIANLFPEISSLLYVDNQKRNDTFNDLDLIVYKGKDYIFERMENLIFKVGAKSFYQTNTEQAYILYKVVRSFVFNDLNINNERPLVYDLYTGTGTIANFVANKASQVIGIEYVPEAIEDAKNNSVINHITNTSFYAGDMKDVFTDVFIESHGLPDVVIVDPPRAGMHPDVIKTIRKVQPKRIVYVSCNPATQARDLQLLKDFYSVKAIQPIDMFPHTPHVENVVLLIRNE